MNANFANLQKASSSRLVLDLIRGYPRKSVAWIFRQPIVNSGERCC